MPSSEINHFSIKKAQRKYIICIDCKGKVAFRKTHLWDDVVQGYRCQNCWYLLIDGRGQEKQVQ